MASRLPRIGQRDSLQALLQALNQKFHLNEVLVTGSMAAMAGLLKQYPGEKWTSLRDISAVCGDVDLVSALPLGPDEVAECSALVRKWLATWSLSDHAIDIVHRDASVALPTLSQAIVPAAQLAVTQDGIVDGHGGQQDIRCGALRVLMPGAAGWRSNPTYRAGLAGGALGVLIWINTSLLLEIASAHFKTAKAGPPLPPGRRSVIELDPLTLSRLELQLREFVPSSVEPRLFSARQRKLRPRLDRSFRLLRFGEHRGLDVARRRNLTEAIENAFLAGATSPHVVSNMGVG